MLDNEIDILITVPEFKKNEDSVQYRIYFQNQKSNSGFENDYRYSELKRFHETLQTLKTELPVFPKSYWWKSVNSNTQLIEQRRQLLDSYFQNLTSIKSVRESLIYKNFLLVALKESDIRVQKENKEKAKRSENQTRKKTQQLGQFITPVPNPVNLPPTPQDKRSSSMEHKPVKSQQRNERKRASKQQSPVLNFGGSKIFRGVLSNAAKQ
ncbi:unnamed protein product (macronuclear) [Paramecium tetraurelia]|uniref:PX domain-containing protein n=1 Tax=Paramecium tetraurelia TaxID=5888 RepID=A0BMS6_PARTE|nr:uncharacterized protein GSPATT00030479001 [Paramecium tetraurelia]CAK59843.1 unnamed protein product [Paramecium tetraurelia]|eukprot:XP_001427241.1 hypothetical protein (macronuclear) [Paramecium tetraurelia strain d4-2]